MVKTHTHIGYDNIVKTAAHCILKLWENTPEDELDNFIKDMSSDVEDVFWIDCEMKINNKKEKYRFEMNISKEDCSRGKDHCLEAISSIASLDLKCLVPGDDESIIMYNNGYVFIVKNMDLENEREAYVVHFSTSARNLSLEYICQSVQFLN